MSSLIDTTGVLRHTKGHLRTEKVTVLKPRSEAPGETKLTTLDLGRPVSRTM